jgi:hypothetical protein
MKKQIISTMLIASSLFAGDLVTFTSGTPAKASEVNDNFTELDSRTKNVISLNDNVGIGTANPTRKLHVNGNVNIGEWSNNEVAVISLGAGEHTDSTNNHN